jgi:hypothetical protein
MAQAATRRRRVAKGGGKRKKKKDGPVGWRTTDADEIARRVERAAAEPMRIRSLDPEEPFYADFAVGSETSGSTYRVEIRALEQRQNTCSCPDYQVNGLGTCKHIEAVLAELRRKPRKFARAAAAGSPRAEIRLERDGAPEVRLELPRRPSPGLKRFAERYFDPAGRLRGEAADAVPALERDMARLHPATRRRLRLSQEVTAWAADRARRARRRRDRGAFERDLAAGRRGLELVQLPLYDYQRQGVLHLAFGERAMLADDMGLGKTVQAVAACALLRQLRGVERVLVVGPASLKAEWQEQIAKFTDLDCQVVYGNQARRREQYRRAPFFTLTNYEQVLRDVAAINELLCPDVVVLDEAQRIKNWSTKTAQAVKRLAAPYAFVLTGTPLENRIDEIYSLVEFLDPQLFGPLFRFNREFYDLDERGRPAGYRNLDELRRRIRPLMLRRRKDEVEDELPARVDNNFFVEMTPDQRGPYQEYEAKVARLMQLARRRPLRREEHDRLQRWLACMRMLCDTPYILDQDCRVCPKLDELERVLEDAGVTAGRKALVFSEWVRMLELVRGRAEELGLGVAWHTGSVPQHKRRAEIERFKNDPDCRLFLSSESGGTGLNLQAAEVVINLDLPWNPARLEQRIARAWRKHQRAAVQVINLVTSDSIEHRMLGTLAVKRELADGVIDGRGDLNRIGMPSSREAFLKKLRVIMGQAAGPQAEPAAVGAAALAEGDGQQADVPPQERFRQDLVAELSSRVLLIEQAPADRAAGRPALVVVDDQAEQLAGRVRRLHRRACGDEAGPVEVIDRNTYATLQRLAELGLIEPAAGGVELHRAEGLGGKPRAEQHRDAARPHLDAAERKLQLARHLDAGGFAAEALEPARQAAEAALRALACIDGGRPAADQPLPAATVHGALVRAGLLEPAQAAGVSALRELAATAGNGDAAAAGADQAAAAGLDHAVPIVERAREKVGAGASA